MKFDGDRKCLAHFLNHVRSFMREFEDSFPLEEVKVNYISKCLEGEAAEWVVELENAEALEL